MWKGWQGKQAAAPDKGSERSTGKTNHQKNRYIKKRHRQIYAIFMKDEDRLVSSQRHHNIGQPAHCNKNIDNYSEFFWRQIAAD